jgi:hypothetical protein
MMHDISINEIHTFTLSVVVTFEPPIEATVKHGWGDRSQVRRQRITSATYRFAYNAKQSMEENFASAHALSHTLLAHNVRKDGSAGASKVKWSVGDPDEEGQKRLAATKESVREAFVEAITKILDTKGIER